MTQSAWEYVSLPWRDAEIPHCNRSQVSLQDVTNSKDIKLNMGFFESSGKIRSLKDFDSTILR